MLFLASTVFSRELFNFSAAGLLLLSIFFYDKNKVRVCIIKNRFFLIPLLLIFLSSLISFLVNFSFVQQGFNLNKIDLSSKFLLLIPIIFLFDQFKFDFNVVSLGFALGAIGAGVMAIEQVFFEHRTLAIGSAGHHIVFGAVSSLLGLASLFICFSSNAYGKIIGTIGFLFAFMAVILSSSRGAWFGMSLLLIIFLVHSFYRSRAVFYTLIAVVLISGATVFSHSSIRGQVFDRVLQAKSDVLSYKGEKDVVTSLSQRILMWKLAIRIFLDHPIVGAGPRSFRQQHKLYAESGMMKPLDGNYAHAHSDLLNIAAAQGALGLAAFAYFFWGLFKRYYNVLKTGNQINKDWAFMGLTLLIGLVLFGLTESMMDRSFVVVFFVITQQLIISQMNFRL
jgi:O-antigen ligase